MALHGGVGGDHQHVAGEGGGAGGLGSGLDDAQHRHGHGVLNGVEGQGAGGVAGDDQELRALLLDQEPRALGGVAGDGAARLGAVGQAGRVAEEGERARGSRAINARSTVRPPKPESKTPMVGVMLRICPNRSRAYLRLAVDGDLRADLTESSNEILGHRSLAVERNSNLPVINDLIRNGFRLRERIAELGP